MNVSDIAALLSSHNCDGLIVSHPAHVTWATGFVSSNALLYLGADSSIVVTDGRYREAAAKLQAKVVIANQENLAHALRPHLGSGKRIGYQSEYVSVDGLKQLEAELAGCKLIPAPGILREQVAAKRAIELAAIERAQAVTDAVFNEVLPLLKPGVTEKAIAAELVYRQLQHGADGLSPEFWPIVAFGANSALPHAHAGDTKLQRGDVVLLDFGCTVQGYCSDMTRTVVCGEPSDEFCKVYDVVLRAQEAALGMIKSGVAAKAVDAVARNIITEAGYGDKFGHGLGHGVGLEIHEWPILNPRSKDVLPPKTVVTVEPGIYLPSKFGVRIEDMVYVGRDEVRNLTKSPKELIVL
jgi:Xaa-Pro aminopeptidase